MRRSAILLSAALLLISSAAPVSAAVAVTAPGGFLAGFVPPVVVISKGEGITYINADIAPHDFVASDSYLGRKAEKKARWCSGFDKGRCPMFWSPQIDAGEQVEVEGLQRVKSGSQYGFYCTVHPNMQGTLVVR